MPSCPVKAARLPQAFIKAVEEFRVGFGDQIAHQPVTADPLVPPHLRVRRQRRLGEPSHDRRLRPEVLTCRLALAGRAIDVAERVSCGRLSPGGMHVLFRAA